MNSRVLIIVSGPPCTGKTTLARRISGEFDIPLFYKDGIKESLMDSLGVGNREESRKLGIATYGVLYHVVESVMCSGNSLVIESNFSPEYSPGELKPLIDRYGYLPLQVQCRTEPGVLFERYMKRAESADRHPGHFDMDYHHLDAVLGKGYLEPLDIGGEIIDIDTTDFKTIDYYSLRATIRGYLKK